MFRNLNAEMARKGLTGKQIAKAIEISQKAFSNRRTGKTDFYASEIVVIAKIFFPGLSVDYLFFENVANRVTADLN